MVLGATVFAAVAIGSAVGAERGDRAHVPRSYKAMWSSPRSSSVGHGARPFRRDSRTLDIAVMDGTCFPSAPAEQTDARRRLGQVIVREARDRVTVAVIMRPERPLPAGEACAGVGKDFLYRVRLRHPVGRRAVVSDQVYDAPDTPIIYRALDHSIQGRLERSYLRPAARAECVETPNGVLAMKYDTRHSGDRAVARAAADGAPRAARETVYRACLAGIRARD